MATVEQGLQSQLRNIEATYGRPIDDWVGLIRVSGLTRHSDIVAMLKADYGLSHGAANRVALVALDPLQPRIDGQPRWIHGRRRTRRSCRSTPG